jgi:hypothetical protein
MIDDQPSLWDHADSLKERGQKRVLFHSGDDWKEKALEVIREAALRHTEFTFDRVRAIAIESGLVDPHHPNAWGAAMSAAFKKGWIRRTGQYRPSSNISAHGRMLAVWKSLL